MTKLIPNTFQCFNDHVDIAMELLTGDEYKVLNFATRHILGWQDSIVEEKKRISLTMFEKGFISKKHNRRFAGTGLGRKSLVRILDFLTDCGLLVVADKANKDGTLWELGDTPDWARLTDRKKEKETTDQKRTSAARTKSLTIRKSGVSHTPDIGVSHTPVTPEVVSVAHTSEECVAHTDNQCVGHTQSNPIQNQLQNQLNTRSSAPPLASVPVVSANNTPMLLPEMLPSKPNGLKEKAQAERSAKEPTPISAPPPPKVDDDFSIVRLHRETWPKTEITPALKDILYADAKKHPREWIIDAFKHAAMNDAKTYRYVNKILTEWQTNGKPELTTLSKTTPQSAAPSPVAQPVKLPRPVLSRPVLPKASGDNENGNS